MSAIRLREAAALLRDRAQAATNFQWSVDGEGTGLPIVWADYDYDGGGQVGDVLADEDAAYIAMMSPPVALALADWLDAEYVTQAEMEPLSEVINASFTAVSGVEAGVLQFGRDPGGNIVFQANTFVGALAVADAILGTPA